ncbi:hypothetical protein GQ42DRAFT_159966 [Ramicandelaber brevisporus]|nr:hypothetical protein GQ42DRAFT_159966 [Ramicandelaber brevisporus]
MSQTLDPAESRGRLAAVFREYGLTSLPPSLASIQPESAAEGSWPTSAQTALFARRLNRKLSSASGDQLAAQISEDISNLVEDHDLLREWLTPISTQQQQQHSQSHTRSELSTAAFTQGHTFIRCLLLIDKLQPDVIASLLFQLPAIVDAETERQLQGIRTTSTSLFTMVLHQIRWLDNVVDARQLSTTLHEISQAIQGPPLIELIGAMPDILPDEVHPSSAQTILLPLIENAAHHAALVAPILDALGNMRCDPDVINAMVDRVCIMLGTVSAEVLPVMLRFLFSTASTPDATRGVIVVIRDKIRLEELVNRLKNDKANERTHRKPSAAPSLSTQQQSTAHTMICEAIEFGIQFREHVGVAWLKIISEASASAPLRDVDFIALFALYQQAASSARQKLDVVIRKLVMSGSITAGASKFAVVAMRGILTRYCKSGLTMVSMLLHACGASHQQAPAPRDRTAPARQPGARAAAGISSGPHVWTYLEAAKLLAMLMFLYSAAYDRQEVIATLISHIGTSKLDLETTSALSVLHQLTESRLTDVRQFGELILGVLDYVDSLSPRHISMLFTVIGLLCSEASGNARIFNDTIVFLRKQLNSPMSRHRMIGVLGAHAVLRRLGTKEPPNSSSNGRVISLGASGPSSSTGAGSSSSSRNMNRPPSNEAQPHSVDLFNAMQVAVLLHQSATNMTYEQCAIVYDQMASLIGSGNLHEKIHNYLNEQLANSFAEIYTEDLSEPTLTQQSSVVNAPRHLLVGRYMGLESGEQCSIALGIHPLMFDSDECSGQPLPVDSDTQALAAMAGNDSQAAQVLRKQSDVGKLACLTSLFRFAAKCCLAVSHGSLDDIEATLSCPVIMTRPSWSLEPDSVFLKEWSEYDRRLACTEAAFCINWFRELINAFAPQAHPSTESTPSASSSLANVEIQTFVIRRVNQLSTLVNLLLSSIPFVKTFDPRDVRSGVVKQSVAADRAIDAEKSAREDIDVDVTVTNDDEDEDAEHSISIDLDSDEASTNRQHQAQQQQQQQQPPAQTDDDFVDLYGEYPLSQSGARSSTSAALVAATVARTEQESRKRGGRPKGKSGKSGSGGGGGGDGGGSALDVMSGLRSVMREFELSAFKVLAFAETNDSMDNLLHPNQDKSASATPARTRRAQVYDESDEMGESDYMPSQSTTLNKGKAAARRPRSKPDRKLTPSSLLILLDDLAEKIRSRVSSDMHSSGDHVDSGVTSAHADSGSGVSGHDSAVSSMTAPTFLEEVSTDELATELVTILPSIIPHIASIIPNISSASVNPASHGEPVIDDESTNYQNAWLEYQLPALRCVSAMIQIMLHSLTLSDMLSNPGKQSELVKAVTVSLSTLYEELGNNRNQSPTPATSARIIPNACHAMLTISRIISRADIGLTALRLACSILTHIPTTDAASSGMQYSIVLTIIKTIAADMLIGRINSNLYGVRVDVGPWTSFHARVGVCPAIAAGSASTGAASKFLLQQSSGKGGRKRKFGGGGSSGSGSDGKDDGAGSSVELTTAEVSYVLEQYLEVSSNTLDIIEEYAYKTLPKLMSAKEDDSGGGDGSDGGDGGEEDEEGASTVRGMLNRSRFLPFFNILSRTLVAVVTQIAFWEEPQMPSQLTAQSSLPTVEVVSLNEISSRYGMTMAQWNTLPAVVRRIGHIGFVWLGMIELVRTVQTRPFVTAVLKMSKSFIDAYTKHALPRLEGALNFEESNIPPGRLAAKTVLTSLLSRLRDGTRIINTLCIDAPAANGTNSSKQQQHQAVISIVPTVKRSLEVFMINIKAVFVRNHCGSTVTVQMYQPKDLSGNRIKVMNPHFDEEEEEEEKAAVEVEQPAPEPPRKKRRRNAASTGDN